MSLDRPSPVVRFDGCWNLRDLGGLVGAQGRRVRSGRVFRSAALDRATSEDLRTLAGMGIRHVFDLRADREREAPAAASLLASGVSLWARDYRANSGDLRDRLLASFAGDGETRDAMLRAYRNLPDEQAPAIAAIFTALAAGRTPLLFHCAVGKDRTGAVAALLLAALGVSREAIVADYLLTNDHADAIKARLLTHPLLQTDADIPAGAWEPLATADPAYLETMFDALASSDGSVDAFLHRAAGIDGGMLDRLRAHLLE